MKKLDFIFLTLTSLKGNILRSFLSSLGVFMGVFAISGTLQVSDIGKSYLNKELQNIESPQIYIYPPYNSTTYQEESYSQADLAFLKQKLSGWRYITTIEDSGNDVIYYQKEKINIESQAVTPEYLSLTGRKLIAGSFFSQNDLTETRPLAVIDQLLAQKLFKGQNPLNQIIYFQNKSYYIKGIIETKKASSWSDSQGLILIPLSVYQSLKSTDLIRKIIISPYNSEDLEKLKNETDNLLKQKFPNQEVWVYSNIEDLKMLEKVLNVVAIILLLIGGIALFVGGVGIANITIASVIERTKEIGLRRAIGATRKNILSQFLLESTLISMVGGVLAIATVQGITIIVVSVLNLPYQFNYKTPLVSLSSAMMVGIVSSFLPALKASKLDPVEALRSE